MKTIKLILSAILMMMAFTVQAQTVQVYKDGAVVKEYPASEIESVEVKQVYYYYAGWECPRNEEELASKGTLIGTTLGDYTLQSPLVNYVANPLKDHPAKEQYYVVIPEKYSIYDQLGNDATSAAFTIYGEVSISGYKVLKSNSGSRNINAIIIY